MKNNNLTFPLFLLLILLCLITSCNNETNSSVLSKYAVTFDTDGGTSTPKEEVTEGSTVTKPEDPTKEHYTFDGWYLNDVKYDFSTPVKANITLVAKQSIKHSFVDDVCSLCSGKKCGDNAAYLFDDVTGTLTITGVGKIKDGTINSDIWGDIGKENIINVEIGEEITEIGDYSFVVASNIVKVNLPSTLQSIGEGAFFGSGIKEITFPAGITKIGERVFERCSNVEIKYEGTQEDWDNKGLAMTDNVNVTFSDGSKLVFRFNSSKTILNGLTPYGSGLPTLDVPIPNTVEKIANEAFKKSNLTYIEIPGSVKNIGQYVFEKCSNLTKVVINEGVETLDINIVNRCSNLTELYLPSTLKECPKIMNAPSSSLTIHYNGTKTKWDDLINGTQGDLKFIKENLNVRCTDKSIKYYENDNETVTDLNT